MATKITSPVLIGIFLLPLTGFASAPAKVMSKDQWLEKLQNMAPNLICKGFIEDASLKKQFDNLHIDLQKCESFIPASWDKCHKQYYAEIPDMITQENASKWGRTLGECIGSDFAINHLVPSSSKSATPATDTSTSSTSGQTSNTPVDTVPAKTSDASAAASATVNKDQWLGKLKEVAPELICKSFTANEAINKKFIENNLNYDKCLGLVPALTEQCKSQYYSNMPAELSKEDAGTWGRKMGECIGNEFAGKYLSASASKASNDEKPAVNN